MSKKKAQQGKQTEESVADWVMRNRDNHAKRVALIDAEGKLLTALAQTATRQENNARREASAKKSRDHERVSALIERGTHLIDIEWELDCRLVKNQDEQERLLKELIDEPTPEQQEEGKRRVEKLDQDIEADEREEGRIRGNLRLAKSDVREKHDEETRHRIDAIIDRILAGDRDAWDEDFYK